MFECKLRSMIDKININTLCKWQIFTTTPYCLKKLLCSHGAVIFLSIIFLPMTAHATNFGATSGGFILVIILQKLLALITSKIGGAVFAIAMAGVGYLWLKAGRMQPGPAITALVSMSLIYGAGWLAIYFGFTS